MEGQAERWAGSAFLGVPAFDAFVSVLDNFSRVDFLVELHEHLPKFLTSTPVVFGCMCVGLFLIHRSYQKTLRRVYDESQTRRLVDTSGVEIRSADKSQSLIPVLIVFLIALLAAPIAAVGYSLASKGPSPKPQKTPAPPYFAFEKTRANEAGGCSTLPRIQQVSSGAGSPNQSMIGSPGGLQAGRDINVTSDRRIIQSIYLQAYIETDTSPSTPTAAGIDIGVGATAALFTASNDRIDFASEPQAVSQQVSKTRRRLSFKFSPQNAEGILGKEISFLSSFVVLGVNCKDVAAAENFVPTANTILHVEVLVNGVKVAAFEASVDRLEKLGVIDVGKQFSNAPAVYAKAVARD